MQRSMAFLLNAYDKISERNLCLCVLVGERERGKAWEASARGSVEKTQDETLLDG